MADTPSTYCRNVGRKVIAPSMAKPTMNARMTEIVNTDERNSRSGRIGSAARDSASTNSPRLTAETTNSPTMVGESQAYWVPPHETARVRQPAPAATHTAPK